MLSRPYFLVVEIHGTLSDDVLSVGALCFCGEVMGGIIYGTKLVPGRYGDP